jgi:hypothetical protein
MEKLQQAAPAALRRRNEGGDEFATWMHHSRNIHDRFTAT